MFFVLITTRLSHAVILREKIERKNALTPTYAQKIYRRKSTINEE